MIRLATLVLPVALAADPATSSTSGPAPRSLSSPAAVRAARTPPADLVDVVPAHTTSLWSWRSDASTRRLEGEVQEVVEAFVGARFDELAFDAMDAFGASPDLVAELRGVQNVLRGFCGLVPWCELARHEIVYAETDLSSLLPGTDLPGLLLACRPGTDAVEEIEEGLAGLMAAATSTLGFVRYDVHEDPSGARRHALVLRGDPDAAILQVALREDVALIGMGEEYFGQALALLGGQDLPRLTSTPRYREAFRGLPQQTVGRSYLDVSRLADDLDELTELLEGKEFDAGLWQGLINGSLELARTVETVASVTRCEGERLTTETMTRFDPDSPEIARIGMTGPASPRLLALVPADVVAFELRGEVDLTSLCRWSVERWKEDWAPASDVLWMGNVLQAVLGLSVEDDVLSWLGSEHVEMTVPAPDGDGTETVVLFEVDDPAAVEKCLERVEGVFHAAAPRLLAQLQDFLLEVQSPFTVSVQLNAGGREHPTLRRLDVAAFPFVMANVVIGTIDGKLAFATSEKALERCLAVGRGEVPGLAERELTAGLVGRSDLCTVRLRPLGGELAGYLQVVSAISGWLERTEDGMDEQADPEVRIALDLALELLVRVEGVMRSFGFLGDSLTTGEARDGGLARYERTTTELRLPAAREAPADSLVGSVF